MSNTVLLNIPWSVDVFLCSGISCRIFNWPVHRMGYVKVGPLCLVPQIQVDRDAAPHRRHCYPRWGAPMVAPMPGCALTQWSAPI